MYDFHCHSTHSDGDLIPAELIRRLEHAGYAGMGISDHCDFSNIEAVLAAALAAAEAERRGRGYPVAAGVEITHVRPEQIGELVEMARSLGAEYVIVHGESPVEPVSAGTNRAAIEAGCDILAHPGSIAPADAEIAAERGVMLEVSGRHGHSLGNGHVARTAAAAGAEVIFGSDTHEPDIGGPEYGRRVLSLAGLDDGGIERAVERSAEFMERVAAAAQREPARADG